MDKEQLQKLITELEATVAAIKDELAKE